MLWSVCVYLYNVNDRIVWVELIALFYVWNDVFGLKYIHTERNKVFRLDISIFLLDYFWDTHKFIVNHCQKILPEVTIFFFCKKRMNVCNYICCWFCVWCLNFCTNILRSDFSTYPKWIKLKKAVRKMRTFLCPKCKLRWKQIIHKQTHRNFGMKPSFFSVEKY